MKNLTSEDRGEYYYMLKPVKDFPKELSLEEDQYVKWVEHHYVVYPHLRHLHWAPKGSQDRKDIEIAEELAKQLSKGYWDMLANYSYAIHGPGMHRASMSSLYRESL